MDNINSYSKVPPFFDRVIIANKAFSIYVNLYDIKTFFIS